MDAYRAPGLYGGDDGITFGVTPRELIDAAKMLGQAYESEPHMRGEPLKFLSRYYGPGVWHGNPSSACDLDRAMRNFNCTIHLDATVTPVMKLLQKSQAYTLTDENTPYLGYFVSAVSRVAGEVIDMSDAIIPMVSWISKFPKEVQYPNAVTHGDLSWINCPPDFDADTFQSWVDEIEYGKYTKEQKLLKFLEPPYCDSRRPTTESSKAAVIEEVLCEPKPVPPVPGLMPCAIALSSIGTISPPPVSVAPKSAPASPCPACTKAGKAVKHTADQCWSGKTPDEVAALRKKSNDARSCPTCLAKGKTATHSPAQCFDGKTPAEIAKIRGSWKKKK